MRYGDAFKVLLGDKENSTNNLLIGSVFTLIPVIGPLALAGWHCEIAQRLHRGEAHPIPRLEFGDLTTWLSRGIAPFVANLLASLPIVVVMVVVQIAVMIAAISQNTGVLIAVGLFSGLIGLAAGIFAAVATMAVVTRAELLEDIGASLKLAPTLAYMKRNVGRILVTTFVASCIAIPLIFLGFAACCIGVLPAQVVIQTAIVHLRVQIYEEHLAEGGDPIE